MRKKEKLKNKAKYKNRKRKEQIQNNVENTISFLGNGFENINMSRDKMSSLFRFNIAFKLTIELTTLFIGILIVINLMLSFVGSYFFYYTSVEELASYNTAIRQEFLSSQDINSNMEILISERNIAYIVVDLDNKFIAASDNLDLTYEEIVQARKYSLVNLNFPDYITNEYVITANRSGQESDVNEENKKQIGIKFLTFRDMSFPNNSLYILRILMMIVSAAICMIIWKTTSETSQKHLSPIVIMNEKINEISTTNLSTRLDISGTKDELKDLAQTFNSMLNEIELGYDSQRRFVSDASHELRTPIAVIKGYGNMLKRWGKDDAEVLDESIDAIIDETENMHSLVESLLFIARNDKNTLDMNMADFDISDLMREIVKETNMIDTDHIINSEILFEGTYYGSLDKLKQALRVFIDNSIKYTPDGGMIDIKLRESDNEVFISIADNGIGISEEDLPKIFERFYRADKSRTKLDGSTKTGGTGLGLAIAKIIIEQHGGKLHAESKLNEGTKLTVILPKKKSKDSPNMNKKS
ncbi:MAG: ATP-binding protein [Acidaminobacteraceae bacterium]